MSSLTKDSKIVIFGASGMVGSAVYRMLSIQGYSNILTPSRSDLDLTYSDKVSEWFEQHKPDVVVVAAARVGGIQVNLTQPADFLLDNVKIQFNIIENAWKFKTSKLLLMASSCMYPRITEQPILEEYLLSSALEPTNAPYALAKISGLKLCESLSRQYGFQSITLVPCNLYGPNDNYHQTNSHVIPALIRKFVQAKIDGVNVVTCWGTGNPKREFMHVDDLASACLVALRNWDLIQSSCSINTDRDKLSYFNVGSGIETTVKDLSLMISNIVGFTGQISWDSSMVDGTPRKLLNSNRFIEFGWAPRIGLDHGLSSVINDYQRDIGI